MASPGKAFTLPYLLAVEGKASSPPADSILYKHIHLRVQLDKKERYQFSLQFGKGFLTL